MNDNKKILVVGDALVDNQVFIDTIPTAGQDIKILSTNLSTGGSAMNTSLSLANLSCDVSLLSRIGHDNYGRLILQRLEKYNVDTSCIQYGSSTGYTIIMIDKNGERTMLSDRGASGESYEFTEELGTTIDNADILLLSGYLLTCKNQYSFIKSLIKKVKKNNGVVAFDPCPVVEIVENEILEFVLKNTDILLPNRHELFCITKNYNIKQSLDTCSIPIIAVKLSDKGSKIRIKPSMCKTFGLPANKDYVLQVETTKANAIDTTGAGDAFNAGFLSAFIKKSDPKSWLEYANKCAYKVVQAKGAVL